MISGLTSPPALHVRASRGTSDPLSPAKTQHSARTGGGRSSSPKGMSSTSSTGAAPSPSSSSSIALTSATTCAWRSGGRLTTAARHSATFAAMTDAP